MKWYTSLLAMLRHRWIAGTHRKGVSNPSTAPSRLMDDARVCLTKALDGLRAIDEELERLANMQRLLAMTAATGASEAGLPDHPFVAVAERARLLAERIERANGLIEPVLRPSVGFSRLTSPGTETNGGEIGSSRRVSE